MITLQNSRNNFARFVHTTSAASADSPRTLARSLQPETLWSLGCASHKEDELHTCRRACRDPSLAKEIILSTCFLIAFARTCRDHT